MLIEWLVVNSYRLPLGSENNTTAGLPGTMSLKVLECYVKDLARGVARIDYNLMDILRSSTGDAIEIKCGKTTVAKCLPLYPSDEGKGIIRLDGIVRENAGVTIGDTVVIRKLRSFPAEKVVVVPLEVIPPIEGAFLADSLESIPIKTGDVMVVQYFADKLKFKVMATWPQNKDSAALVTQRTNFEILDSEKGPVSINIEQSVRQEVETFRVVAGERVSEKDVPEQNATPFYFCFKIELTADEIVERIDFQKRLTREEVNKLSHLHRKYQQIATKEVKQANSKFLDAKISNEQATFLGKDREKALTEILTELKYEIVKKFADAKAE